VAGWRFRCLVSGADCALLLGDEPVANAFAVALLYTTDNAVSFPLFYTFPPNTATPSGGTPSYTYQWNETDDNQASWTLTNATTATVTVSVRGAFGGFSRATLTCTVTDNLSNVVTSGPCQLSYTSSNDN